MQGFDSPPRTKHARQQVGKDGAGDNTLTSSFKAVKQFRQQQAAPRRSPHPLPRGVCKFGVYSPGLLRTLWATQLAYTHLASQRSLHNAPIFRLLLKVAVNGTHQCDFLNFCGGSGPQQIIITGLLAGWPRPWLGRAPGAARRTRRLHLCSEGMRRLESDHSFIPGLDERCGHVWACCCNMATVLHPS